MQPSPWIEEQARLSLNRLLPRIHPFIEDPRERVVFDARLRANIKRIFRLVHHLYGAQYDFFYHLEQILITAARLYNARSPELKQLDQQRETQPLWFQSEKMVGGVCYVDLFAGDLAGIRAKLPYFEELGLTYLHLMPLFRCPEHNNDGGYAVSSFREVNPRLGTMEQLADLITALRDRGISLVLDFVFNHTSDEHDWALRALQGDAEHQAYYRMFDDRIVPDMYEPHLREIFPEQSPGSFTYRQEIGKWVWTTFNHFQWDLNYANPALFCAMLEEMLFLANQGVEILRLDAVPFIWKQLGTSCENLPEAHLIIQAYTALTRVVCPALLFKSEAIVHPRDVRSYIGWDECPLSYNPIMMVSLWEALATRDVEFMRLAMHNQFALPHDCAWINYVRSHDDIGWGFADEDAAALGINGHDHRFFLNQFYTGQFPGSFATGLPFNYNPRTQDMRISGTTASLAGLEQALKLDNALYRENALKRIILIYSICLSAGGIPLIYLGDEIATLNDYSYEQDPAKAQDSRWVHRPFADWDAYGLRSDPTSLPGDVFQRLRHLIQLRKQTPALANGETEFLATSNRHVLAYARHQSILCAANFSDFPQEVDLAALCCDRFGEQTLIDLVTGRQVTPGPRMRLEPYEFLWLQPETARDLTESGAAHRSEDAAHAD